ncbi:MAG: hypothetical protein M1820_009984 [Bogoriella megaspora]|nr:MAG: hypothetical protein M1820_009984 [Bogoriella megaspora]
MRSRVLELEMNGTISRGQKFSSGVASFSPSFTSKKSANKRAPVKLVSGGIGLATEANAAREENGERARPRSPAPGANNSPSSNVSSVYAEVSWQQAITSSQAVSGDTHLATPSSRGLHSASASSSLEDDSESMDGDEH